MSTQLTDTPIAAVDIPLETLNSLDLLESEAIHIIREVVAEFERPALLFSGGKDSVVMLHLATKAFWPGKVPFPVLHVDTGHNFPEVIDFRDRTVERLGLRLEVGSVQDFIDSADQGTEREIGGTRARPVATTTGSQSQLGRNIASTLTCSTCLTFLSRLQPESTRLPPRPPKNSSSIRPRASYLPIRVFTSHRRSGYLATKIQISISCFNDDLPPIQYSRTGWFRRPSTSE